MIYDFSIINSVNTLQDYYAPDERSRKWQDNVFVGRKL
jgi:hypothetical protein